MALADKTIVDTVHRQVREQVDAIAFQFEGRQTTFRQFDLNSNKVANALVASGIKPGDHIAYLGKNSDTYFELMIGAMKMGAITTPVNWRLAPPEVVYITNDLESPIVFVGPELTTLVRQVAPQLKTVKTIVAMEGGEAGWLDFAKWRDAQPDTPPKHQAKEGDVSIQLYTSGTTGHPKGAMLSHKNLLDLRDDKYGAVPEANVWLPGDVSLISMPAFHIAGSGLGIYGLYYGVKSIIARDFDPGQTLEVIEKERVSKLFLVPAALQFMVRHPRARQTDYSSVKFVLYGASPIPLELLKECMEVMGCGFVQVYGMTETTGAITYLPSEDHSVEGNQRMRSAGKPYPGVEMAVLDAEGKELPPGQTGEIATRSNNNMVGYWKLPDASKSVITKDGWLRTGDAGYMDEDGYIYIQDRIKDMIISGGENIYPAEVENAIFGHPAIADVAVVGVPDEKWGESVKAIVVRKPGAEISADDVIAYARKNIAGYKSPRSVDFIEALPRNASGKILRRQLREPYWANKDRRVN